MARKGGPKTLSHDPRQLTGLEGEQVPATQVHFCENEWKAVWALLLFLQEVSRVTPSPGCTGTFTASLCCEMSARLLGVCTPLRKMHMRGF